MTTELFPPPDWAELSPYNIHDNELAPVLLQVDLEQHGRRTAITLLRGLRKRNQRQQDELDELVLLVTATEAELEMAVDYD